MAAARGAGDEAKLRMWLRASLNEHLLGSRLSALAAAAAAAAAPVPAAGAPAEGVAGRAAAAAAGAGGAANQDAMLLAPWYDAGARRDVAVGAAASCCAAGAFLWLTCDPTVRL